MDSLPESTVPTFKHETLPDAANHMRLLEVLDGNYSDTSKVRCSMTTWPTDNTPTYHAISYTWGDPKSNTTIIINNKQFLVRTNCEFVLKQALWHAKSRYYWIDAICIDQDNLDEKSNQVAMMGNIYKRADHVLACVGDHVDDSLFIFQNFDRFSPFVCESSPDDNSLILRLYWRVGFSTTKRFIRACMNFSKRPYFSRLGVLQELKNARHTSLLCGRGAMPKDEFLQMFKHFKRHLLRKVNKLIWRISWFLLERHATRKGHRSRIYEQLYPKSIMEHRENDVSIWCTSRLLSEDIDTLTLVRLTSRLQCTIPKDRVYGIISILNSGDDVSIIPDYAKSEFEIALDFLHAIWKSEFAQEQEHSSGLQLLDVCYHTVYSLDLHGENLSGAIRALAAREGPPANGTRTIIFKDADIVPRPWQPPAPSLAIGYRILGYDLVDGFRELLKYWTPPGVTNIKVLVPYWARKGDWIVHMKECTLESDALCLLLRQEAESSSMRIMGHCYTPSFESLKLVGTAFRIFWDPEDILVFSLVRASMLQEKIMERKWVERLLTSVSRRATPWSSYGVMLPRKPVT